MSFELFFDLDADWRIVAGSRAATDAMQRWANDPVLGACRSLDELLARTAAGADRADAESVLRALVRLAPDDDIAARTVLQALVPALVSVARRVGAADNPDAAAEVVAVAWTKIRHAIGSQRRGSIAANLVLEVLHVVWRSQHALAEQLVAPADLGRVAASDEPGTASSPTGREVLELVGGSGSVPPEQLRLISDAVLDRVPVSVAARQAGISVKAMTRRRERARARVVHAYTLARSA